METVDQQMVSAFLRGSDESEEEMDSDIVSEYPWNSGSRVATVREKYLENEIFSRSGKSQGILWMARETKKGLGKSGKSQGI